MTIAVIIPAKNEEEALPKLLDSLVAQTNQPDEVIVVDSHSTDHTVKKAQSYAKKLPLIVVTAKIRGLAAARNAGAATTKADYLLFVDSDITLPPDFIAAMRRAIDQRHLDIGAFRQVMTSRKAGIRIGSRMMNLYVRVMSVTPWPILFSCFFIRRELFEAIGGFDLKIYIMEDYDMALRGRRTGGKFGIVGGTKFYASPRRYDVDGGGKSILRGFYGELYRYTHGMRVTEPIYRYEMGGKGKDEKKG